MPDAPEALYMDIVFLATGLLPSEGERQTFVDRRETEIVRQLMPNATFFTMSKERIRIELGPDRTSVRKDYPEKAESDQLAHIAVDLIQSTVHPPELTALGYNVHMVYDLGKGEMALERIGERLLSSDISLTQPFRIHGGAVKLYSTDELGQQWTFVVDSRFSDPTSTKAFLATNLHIASPSPQIATAEEMAARLTEVWLMSEQFLEGLQ